MGIRVFYTANDFATGGRNGNTKTDDGLVDVNLSIPKAMGSPGKEGTTTPEHLLRQAMPPVSAAPASSCRECSNSSPKALR